MKKTDLALIKVAAAGCLWGTMGFFVRQMDAMGLNSMQMVELRSVATATLGIIALLLYDKRLLKVRLKDLWCFAGTGLFSTVLFNYCYFSAIRQMSLSSAAVLLYMAPVFVMLLSHRAFGEPITRWRVLCLALVTVGCVLVSNIQTAVENLSATGILFGLGAGFGYALYSIFSRYALERGYQPLTITVYTFLFAALGGALLTDLPGFGRSVAEGDPKTWLFFAAYAVVTTILPYCFYTSGLAQIQNSTASMVAAVEPVTASLLGAALYREIPSICEAAGVVLVMAGVLLLGCEKRSAGDSPSGTRERGLKNKSKNERRVRL